MIEQERSVQEMCFAPKVYVRIVNLELGNVETIFGTLETRPDWTVRMREKSYRSQLFVS